MLLSMNTKLYINTKCANNVEAFNINNNKSLII